MSFQCDCGEWSYCRGSQRVCVCCFVYKDPKDKKHKVAYIETLCGYCDPNVIPEHSDSDEANTKRYFTSLKKLLPDEYHRIFEKKTLQEVFVIGPGPRPTGPTLPSNVRQIDPKLLRKKLGPRIIPSTPDDPDATSSESSSSLPVQKLTPGPRPVGPQAPRDAIPISIPKSYNTTSRRSSHKDPDE